MFSRGCEKRGNLALLARQQELLVGVDRRVAMLCHFVPMKMPLMGLTRITNAELEGVRREDSVWSAVVLSLGACSNEGLKAVVPLEAGGWKGGSNRAAASGHFFVVQLPEEAKAGRCWSEGVEQAILANGDAQLRSGRWPLLVRRSFRTVEGDGWYPA